MSRVSQRLSLKGSFLGNVATLSGAAAFSQLVVFAALPILTRLYAPAEYGAATIYGGIVALVVVVATFRYELAIPLPRSDWGALHVAIVSLIVLAAVNVSIGLAAPLVHAWTGKETGLSGPVFTGLVVIGVAAAGAYQVTNYWAVRKSKFGAIARASGFRWFFL